MNIVFVIFQAIAWALNVYMLIIFARVMITWIPSWSQSAVGRFLGTLCDPYLNWFKRFTALRTASLDFSPVLGIGVLVLLASVFSNFVLMQRISVGIVFAVVISVLWSFIRSFITFLLIFLIVRLIFEFVKRGSGADFWQRMDAIISPIAYKLTGLLFPRRFFQYRTVLIMAIVALILIQFAGGWIFGFIGRIFLRLPI